MQRGRVGSRNFWFRGLIFDSFFFLHKSLNKRDKCFNLGNLAVICHPVLEESYFQIRNKSTHSSYGRGSVPPPPPSAPDLPPGSTSVYVCRRTFFLCSYSLIFVEEREQEKKKKQDNIHEVKPPQLFPFNFHFQQPYHNLNRTPKAWLAFTFLPAVFKRIWILITWWFERFIKRQFF